MTEFEEKVYDIVAKIPKGSVMTYKEVAIAAGYPNAFRAVGAAMKKNYRPEVPCHRVVRSDDKVGQYNRGGATRKAEMLKEEGYVHQSHVASAGIPKKYQGLPSRLVRELWPEPRFRDLEKRARESQIRADALAQLHEQELVREHDRARLFDQLIATLPEARRKDWPLIEQIVKQKIADHIMTGTTLDRNVTPDELALLESLVASYGELVREKKSAPRTTLRIDDSFDQLIYRNLAKGMALDIASTMEQVSNIVGVEASPLLAQATPYSSTPLIEIALGR